MKPILASLKLAQTRYPKGQCTAKEKTVSRDDIGPGSYPAKHDETEQDEGYIVLQDDAGPGSYPAKHGETE